MSFQFLFADDTELISWIKHSKTNFRYEGTKRIKCVCSHINWSSLVVSWTINTNNRKVVHLVYVALLAFTYNHFFCYITNYIFNVIFLLSLSEYQLVFNTLILQCWRKFHWNTLQDLGCFFQYMQRSEGKSYLQFETICQMLCSFCQ